MTAAPRYVFVGAFRDRAHDGSIGGQIVACATLVASPLSDRVRWIELDSTTRSANQPAVSARALRAVGRLATFARRIGRADGALIFSSAHLSFVEKGLMALLAGRLGKRVVVCPRSGLLLDDLERSRFMRWFVPFVLQRCDVVVCQGESWKTRFRGLDVPAEKLAVIPNWLDTGPYARLAAERTPGDTRTFVYMGRIERYKGIFDLIAAVDRQRDGLERARFVICGGGSAEGEARRRVTRLGLDDRFEFRGWVAGEAKNETWRDGEVLVLPSHREGMPNAVLEAMAAGLAVIATRVGGVPDILTGDEHGGVLIEPGDVEALGAALAALAGDRDRCRTLGRAARDHVASRHDITRIWPRMLAALAPDSVCGSHS